MSDLKLKVSFTRGSIGKEPLSRGVNATSQQWDERALRQMLCNRKLIGTIYAGDDDPDQTTIEEDVRPKITGAFETGRLSFGSKDLSFRLTFDQTSENIVLICEFANQDGFLVVEQSEDKEKE